MKQMCAAVFVLFAFSAAVFGADIKKIDEEAEKHIDSGNYIEAILLYAKHAKKADKETMDLLIERIDTTAKKIKEGHESATAKKKESDKTRTEAWQGARASETLNSLLQSFIILANKKEYAAIADRVDEELRFITDSYTRQHLNAYKAAAKDLDNLLASFLKEIDKKIGGPFVIMGLNGTLESFKDGKFVLSIGSIKKNFNLEQMRVVDMAMVQGWTGKHGMYHKVIGEDLLLRGNQEQAKSKFLIAKKKGSAVDDFLAIFERAQTQRFKEHFTLGEEYRVKRKYVEAADEYKKALTIRPDDFTSLYQAGECLYRTKKYAEAENLLAKAENIDPANIPLQRRYAETLKQTKKYSKAGDQYRKIMDLDPTNYNAMYNISWCHYVLKDYEKASSSFEKCIELNKKASNEKNNNNPLRHLAWAHAKMNKWDQALKYHDTAIKLNPTYYYLHYEKGRTLVEMGRVNEGLKFCEKAKPLANEAQQKSIDNYIKHIKEREKKK